MASLATADLLKLALPPAESPFLEQFLADPRLSEGDRALAREFASKGYVVIDTGIEDFDELAARVVAELAPHYPEGVHRRIDEAWYFSDGVRRIAGCERVLELLRTLYRREPIPFQTLNFDRGTQQPAHSDTLHFHCVPRRFMCGVWVALEDIHPDAGPLIVYPGSHTLPDLDMHDLGLTLGPEHYEEYEVWISELVRAKGFQELAVTPRKGQAIVWAANLLHGGMAVRDDSRTRQSQATHYYFEDGLYYFPMSSDPYMKNLCMREVLDIRTGRFVPHRYRGEQVDLGDFFEVWAYPRPLHGWVDASSAAPSGRLQAPEASLERLQARVRTLQGTVANQRAEADELRGTVDLLVAEGSAHRAIIADREAELAKTQGALREILESRADREAELAKAQGALREILESRSFKLARRVTKILGRLLPQAKKGDGGGPAATSSSPRI
jgi:hypothetical protein